MSDKRNLNRSASPVAGDKTALTKSDEIIRREPTVSDSSPDKNGIAAYLTDHWLTIALLAFLAIGAFGAAMKYLEDGARRAAADGTNQDGEKVQSLLSKFNPFSSAPLPTTSPTPQMSKEYIYAGSRLLAVEDANTNAAPPADLAVFRPSTGGWWVLNSSGNGYTGQNWGVNGDRPVPGDFDGDGKTDFAIFHPADGSWQVLQSSNSAGYGFQFGRNSDQPVQADYDGDGKTDFAIFRNENENGVWYIRKSSTGGVLVQQWGLASDTPTPADFDGDGKADLALFRSSEAKFYYLVSGQNNSTYQMIQFGNPGDRPVPGDYDGDGRADAAVWRANYTWHIKNSSNGAVEGYTFGDPNSDKYVQNDYDGDGKVDRAFWRPSNGTWYIVNSATNTQRVEQWGMAGDIPVPAFYRR